MDQASHRHGWVVLVAFGTDGSSDICSGINWGVSSYSRWQRTVGCVSQISTRAARPERTSTVSSAALSERLEGRLQTCKTVASDRGEVTDERITIAADHLTACIFAPSGRASIEPKPGRSALTLGRADERSGTAFACSSVLGFAQLRSGADDSYPEAKARVAPLARKVALRHSTVRRKSCDVTFNPHPAAPHL